ncbi:HNH endonuclease [filamentous cyanobacterium Phorm 6]|nr:HNH endonuclease [filamentous cyanobacterium Phorm 6]
MSINRATRNLARSRAGFLCEYCHSAEESSSTLFTIDHILPRSIGGSDELENLALACHRCNNNRYNFISGTDPETEQEVTLFNPRQQQWLDHFIWSADGLEIMGITPTGRGNCDRLDLNDRYHNERAIIKARRLWIRAGWHPPSSDYRQNS